jgi:hypothetical protein
VKPIYEVPVATMTWKEFVDQIRNDRYASLERRLELLNRARVLFANADHFNSMDEDERKLIAGLPTTLVDESGWFGSMIGSGLFRNRIAENDVNISRALDHIPFVGQLTRAHFDGFC